MLHVFLDSNIWLSLYHYSNNDLKQIRKLVEMVDGDKKRVRLYISQQVKDEVLRNRDSKISDAIKKFEENFPKQISFPNILKGYSEENKVKDLHKELIDNKTKLIEKLTADLANMRTTTDKIIKGFFENEKDFQHISEEILMRAKLRMEKGNPPGKGGSFGDAINWEWLLEVFPRGEDLYFISEDKDYSSALDKNTFNLFLLQEWEKKKSSKVRFFQTLPAFTSQVLKDIKLADEAEKDTAINGLLKSHSYSTTHEYIYKLSKYSDWEKKQIYCLCQAAIINNQVKNILGDEDVFNFYSGLLGYSGENIEDLESCLKKKIESYNN